MTDTSKWTAFLLSACVPGAGQLAARSVSSVAWFAAAAGLVVVGAAMEQWFAGEAWILPLHVAAGMALCLVSAEHAKRLLERRGGGKSAVIGSRVSYTRVQGRSVDLLITLEVAQSRERLWSQIRNLPQFLTLDPFHDQVTLMRDEPAVGVDLVLSHNALGRRFLRFGRIVAWREGWGYTFSDLSPRGPRMGFPHVFMVRIDEGKSASSQQPMSRLTIRVRGRWTSRVAPVWVGRLWVWLISREHARLLQKGL